MSTNLKFLVLLNRFSVYKNLSTSSCMLAFKRSWKDSILATLCYLTVFSLLEAPLATTRPSEDTFEGKCLNIPVTGK
jgi:hypothetical protein